MEDSSILIILKSRRRMGIGRRLRLGEIDDGQCIEYFSYRKNDFGQLAFTVSVVGITLLCP